MEEFKHLNPRKLESYVRGYEIKRKREDSERWQEWTKYAIPAMTVAVRNGAYGRNKVEFPAKPYLSESNQLNVNNEKDLQKAREQFVLDMKIRKANWDLAHGKKNAGSN